jgi:hypothetical protein
MASLRLNQSAAFRIERHALAHGNTISLEEREDIHRRPPPS